MHINYNVLFGIFSFCMLVDHAFTIFGGELLCLQYSRQQVEIYTCISDIKMLIHQNFQLYFTVNKWFSVTLDRFLDPIWCPYTSVVITLSIDNSAASDSLDTWVDWTHTQNPKNITLKVPLITWTFILFIELFSANQSVV